MTTSVLHSQGEALKAFSKQAKSFDAEDTANPILVSWRNRIHEHVERFLAPSDRILELNAGTGIDATYFASQGYSIHATEAADGMIHYLTQKMIENNYEGRLTCQQASFDHLGEVQGPYEYVFSNFGGLNCTPDLAAVAKSISPLLLKGGTITWVVMPPVSLWEWGWALKGRFQMAFRRLKSGGTNARLEGYIFKTYYHSLKQIQKALGTEYKLMMAEGLGICTPPPAALSFQNNFPRMSSALQKIESKISSLPPFNRMGDHIIATFKKV